MADAAKIKIGVEGADEVVRAAERIKTAWQQVAAGGKEMGQAITSSVQGVLSDLGRVITVAGSISFASAAQQVRDFEDSTSRMAAATGQDVKKVREAFTSLAGGMGLKPEELEGWNRGVGKLTYDFKGAQEMAAAFQKEAIAANRPLQDFGAFAVTLRNIGHTGSDVTGVLAGIRKQAAEMGTTGGPVALMEQFAGVGGALSKVRVQGEADVLKITGLLAALGKGLDPVRAGIVHKQLAARFTADPMAEERYLGGKWTDEQGLLVDLGATMQAHVAKVKKEYPRSWRRILQQQIGPEGGAALARMSEREFAGAPPEGPAGGPPGAFEAWRETPSGKRASWPARALGSLMGGTLGEEGVLGRASQWVGESWADDPILTSLGILVGSKAALTATGVGVGLAGNGLGVGGGLAGKGLLAGGGAIGGTAAVAGAGVLAAGGIGGYIMSVLMGEEIARGRAKAGGWTVPEQYQTMAGIPSGLIDYTRTSFREKGKGRGTPYVPTDPGEVKGVTPQDYRLDMAQALAVELRKSPIRVEINVVNASGGPVDAVQTGKSGQFLTVGANATPSFEVFTFKGLELHGNLIDFADTLKPDLATHRIPKRDGARIERMGQAANRFRFKIVFLGASARGNYTHLAVSIQEDPSGLLIHPLLGQRTVVCEGWDGASVNIPMARETIEIPLSFVENALDPSISDAEFVTVSERKAKVNEALVTFSALTVWFLAAADVAVSLTSEATAYATAAEAAYNGNTVDPSTASLLESVATATDAAIAAIKADPLAADAADCQPVLDAAEQVYAACVLLDEAVAADKPAIVVYTVPATMHVAAIAAILYGADGALHIDEILTLNRVANPGAIPGGTVLRVSEPTV